MKTWACYAQCHAPDRKRHQADALRDGGLAIELDELRRAVAAADPSAILVPDRILRRVIRQDRRLRWLGGSHPKCYAIAGAALGAIVDAPELGRPSGSAWPAMALLIAQHGSDELVGTDPGPVLIEAWRRLFHVRVACEVARSIESGAIDASGLDARIEAIGRAEFDEARTVLRQDGVLLSPESDASAYAAFAAVFLELTFFVPAERSSVFPAIESVGTVEAILARDVDGKAILAATRPTGAPGPSPRPCGPDRPPDPDSGSGTHASPRAVDSRSAAPCRRWPPGPGWRASAGTTSGRRSCGRDRPGGPARRRPRPGGRRPGPRSIGSRSGSARPCSCRKGNPASGSAP